MKRLLVAQYFFLLVMVFAGSVPWLVCLWLAALRRVPWSVPLIGIALYVLVIYGTWKMFGPLLRKSLVRKSRVEQDPI